MSFTITAVTSGAPSTGYSQPERVSFVAADSGAGGQVALNGLGVTSGMVANAVDLRTLFGAAAFHSYPLLRAFKAAASAQAAFDQFFQNLNIQINAMSSTGIAEMPGLDVAYGTSGGGATTPYLLLCGPSATGMWRFDISLRHSTPG